MEILYFIYIVFAVFIFYILQKCFKRFLISLFHENFEVQYIYTFSPENKECSICLEDNTNVKLNCNHHFHENCILDWFQHDVSCPICRSEV